MEEIIYTQWIMYRGKLRPRYLTRKLIKHSDILRNNVRQVMSFKNLRNSSWGNARRGYGGADETNELYFWYFKNIDDALNFVAFGPKKGSNIKAPLASGIGFLKG